MIAKSSLEKPLKEKKGDKKKYQELATTVSMIGTDLDDINPRRSGRLTREKTGGLNMANEDESSDF